MSRGRLNGDLAIRCCLLAGLSEDESLPIIVLNAKGLTMPSLSFFIDERDAGLLLARLNTDPEVAFIVPDGRPEKRKAKPRRGQAFVVQEDEPKTEAQTPRHWKAVRTVDALADGFHSLWHVPAGPLPLVEPGHCPGPAPLRPLLGPGDDPLCSDPGASAWVACR